MIDSLTQRSYAIFWLLVMIAVGWVSYKAVIDQPNVMPEDRKSENPIDKLGGIRARTPRLEEIGPDGNVRWRIESEDMAGDIEGEFQMENTRVIIQMDDGGEIVMTSPLGIYDRPTQKLTMKEGVVASFESEEMQFWAQEISWDGEARILKSAGGEVKMTRRNWTFHASSINIDLSSDKTRVDLDEPVQIEGFK